MNRKALPVAFAVLLSGSLAFAQQPQPQPQDLQVNAVPAHAPNPHRQTMHLAKELNLTPDQRAKVEPILANRDQQIVALRTNSSLAPADLHKQMRAIQQSTREQLSSVLTPDQMQQFISIQHSHHDREQADPAAPTT